MTAIKERPILFSGAMVRALLVGTKTQTRRTIKPQPTEEEQHPGCFRYNGPLVSKTGPFGILAHCPYGAPGERLWVRESWMVDYASWSYYQEGGISIKYAADNKEIMYRREDAAQLVLKSGKDKPSIHMPRWASRILLEIVSVRVERLQDISEADAVAEGIEVVGADCWGLGEPYYKCYTDPKGDVSFGNPVASYRSLWGKINGLESWEANPWVWVVEFKRINS